MAKANKRPTDTNQLAKSILDIATGEQEDTISKADISSAAAALGRKGGLKGGIARKNALSPERRAEIAKKAAAARWHKKE